MVEAEREAIAIAYARGPAFLAKHGLKYFHFTELRADLFRVLELAAKESNDGIPDPVKVRSIIATLDHPELAAVELLEGKGFLPNHAEWYATEIIKEWGIRES